ncbi:hypothetical protein HDV64DRAFT_252764 [Trichoderma sp. TUCIM 5745]
MRRLLSVQCRVMYAIFPILLRLLPQSRSSGSRSCGYEVTDIGDGSRVPISSNAGTFDPARSGKLFGRLKQ